MLSYMKLVKGDGTSIMCIEREREALLKFKHGVLDEHGILSSWGSEEDKKECCKWRGIQCSNRTSHITVLDLQTSVSSTQSLGGKISPSLFELSHLKYLNIHNNYFSGAIPLRLGNLTNNELSHLKYLNIHNNYFSGAIPLRLGNLTNLCVLDLGFNFILTVENLDWLSHLRYNWLLNFSSNLIDIDMSNNPLGGSIPYAFGNTKSLVNLSLAGCLLEAELPKSFRNLTRLRTLEIPYNNLTGQLPEFFQSLATDGENSLEILDLGSNLFSGSLPDFTRFKSLRILELANNKLNGSFPKSFGRVCSLAYLNLFGNKMTGLLPELTLLPSLQSLYLTNNRLNGRLPKSIGQLSKLKFLLTPLNSFEGTISEAHLLNLSNLKELDLSFSSLAFQLRADWTPPFQLDVIRLQHCNLGTHFPKWLQSQHNFSELDISSTGISDTVPIWFWDLSPQLEYLNMSYNQIYGVIPDLSMKFSGFPRIDLSSNHFDGPIPLLPPNVTSLHMSKNMLTGSILFLCTIANEFFNSLDLSGNLLSGDLPNCWMSMKELVILNLANNNFSGKIPTSIGSLHQLQTLHLCKNDFIGELPSSIKNCRFWTSQNNISRNIPHCFNKFTSLVETNSSSGMIGFEITAYDYGVYYGVCEYMSSALMQWKGKESEYKNILGLLKLTDLSSNNLSGNIPREFVSLEGLVSLNLSRNNLTGDIIQTIGQMKMLEILDLSVNQLSGEIPTDLASLTFLSVLDLSNNNFSGKIPSSTQLQTFDASVYAGNRELCGVPLPNECQEDETNLVPPSIDHGKYNNIQEVEDTSISLGFYISVILGFVIGFWGLCVPLLLSKARGDMPISSC
ncbi:hypothetical protein LguiA_031861 [Lonicera macranthoides]